MLVSVIIPTFNGRDTITQCLTALLNQDWDGDIEIIVVDDGSSDGTMESVRSFPGVSLLRQNNAGPAAARNRGALTARGDVLLFTDDDCQPLPDFVRRMVAPLQQDVGIVGTKGTYLSRQATLIARFRQVEYEERYALMKRHRYTDFIDTYAAAFRKDAFSGVGGFDENVLAAEDADLSFRLAARGERMVFVPEARVYHRHCETLSGYIRVKIRAGFWRMKIASKLPKKIFRDSHTPYLMKFQVFTLPALLGAGLTAFASMHQALSLLTTILFIFSLSCIPFVLFAVARDPAVAVAAPALLLVRSVAHCVGLIAGLLSLGGTPKAPARPGTWYRNRASRSPLR